MATIKNYNEVCKNENYRTNISLKVKGKRGTWIDCEGYESIHIDEDTLPKGKHTYYCRHADNNLSKIVGVKKNKSLTVNYWGTIVTDKPIDFGTDDELVISKTENEDEGYGVIIVFGENCAKAYMFGGFDEMRKKLDEGQLVRRVFDTKEERDAYIRGIDDADGWMGSAVMDKADVRKHPKLIESMLW